MHSIKLVDEAFKHHSVDYICELWPSDIMRWDRLPPNAGDTVVFTDRFVGLAEPQYNNVALLLEPYELVPDIYQWVIDHQNRFKLILSHDARIKGLPMGRLYHYGGSWIKPEDAKIYDKSKDCSIIVSAKDYTPNQRLRHLAVKRLGDKVDVYGRGYNPVDYKLDALKDYKFSIVIENVSTDECFTEKLLDCFLTGTVPIYYGTNSVLEHFDRRGIVTFSTLLELESYFTHYTLATCPDAILNNFNLAKKFVTPENRIFQILKEEGLV